MIYLLIAYAQMSLMGGCAQEVLLILGGASRRRTGGTMRETWEGAGQKCMTTGPPVHEMGWGVGPASVRPVDLQVCRAVLFSLSFQSPRGPWEPFFTTHFQRPPSLPPHAERPVFGRGCGGSLRMEGGRNKLNGVEKETERPRRDICGHPGPAPLFYPRIPGALCCGKVIKLLSKLLYVVKTKRLIAAPFLFYGTVDAVCGITSLF